jgi:hypothetical protein
MLNLEMEREQGLPLFLIQSDLRWINKRHGITARGWHTYAHSSKKYVRAAVASRKDCPADLLETLSQDEESGVRYCVAANTGASASLIRAVAKRALKNERYEPQILHALKHNPHTSWFMRLRCGWRMYFHSRA